MNKVVTSLKEKICYAFGNMGGYVLWSFTSAYITVYATDCLSFSSDGWAYGVLGTIVLLCRFCDGFSDIAMGYAIDRTHTRYGKAKPWFAASIIPLVLIFFLLFNLQGRSEANTLVIIGILYFLFTVVLYTVNNVAFNAMLPRISNDSYDQTKISTLGSIFTSVGSLANAMAIPLLGLLGGSDNPSAWRILVLILAAIGLAAEIICVIGVKEKDEIAAQSKQVISKEEMHRGFAALLKTKYFYIAVGMFLINYYMSLSITSVGKYYSQWVLGNVNYYSLFGSLPMITMGIGLVMTPLMAKKLGKRKTMIMAVGFVLAGNILGSLSPYSLAVALTGAMIKGFGSATVMCELFTLAADIVRYVEARNGVRVEGLAAAANSFGCKIGSGIGSAVVIWTIAWCRYDAAASAVSAAVKTAFITLYWWIPALLSLVLLLLASRWDIEEKIAEEKQEK